MKNLGCFMLFGGGFVSAMNIMILMGHNTNYDANWYKVAFALTLAAVGISIVRSEK